MDNQKTKKSFWLNEIEAKGIDHVEEYLANDRSSPLGGEMTRARINAVSEYKRKKRWSERKVKFATLFGTSKP